MARTRAIEMRARAAKAAKMRLSGVCRSVRMPKIQSATPPNVMLTKFMMP